MFRMIILFEDKEFGGILNACTPEMTVPQSKYEQVGTERDIFSSFSLKNH